MINLNSLKKKITIDNETFEVDKDFIDLLIELNRVGLKTTQHCSGHKKGRTDSYLSIDMVNCDVWIRNIDSGKVRLVIRWNRFGKKLYE